MIIVRRILFGTLGLLADFVVISFSVVLFQGSVGVLCRSPKRRTAPTYKFVDSVNIEIPKQEIPKRFF